MASDKQPPTVKEGAAPNAAPAEADDEVAQQLAAKPAEDRKAAAALSKLDAHHSADDSSSAAVDHEAVKNAVSALGSATAGAAPKAGAAETKKVKVDSGDVALLVDQLDLPKIKATELLKAHDGDAVKAIRAYLTPEF